MSLTTQKSIKPGKNHSAILQYIKNGPDDIEHVDKILKNHFIASLLLYKGLEKAKGNIHKKEED